MPICDWLVHVLYILMYACVCVGACINVYAIDANNSCYKTSCFEEPDQSKDWSILSRCSLHSESLLLPRGPFWAYDHTHKHANKLRPARQSADDPKCDGNWLEFRRRALNIAIQTGPPAASTRSQSASSPRFCDSGNRLMLLRAPLTRFSPLEENQMHSALPRRAAQPGNCC